MGEEGRLLGSFDRSNLDLKSFDVCRTAPKPRRDHGGDAERESGLCPNISSRSHKQVRRLSRLELPPSALISAGRSRVTQNDLEKTRTHIHTHARTRRIVIADFRSSTSSNRSQKLDMFWGKSKARSDCNEQQRLHESSITRCDQDSVKT